MVDAKKGDLGLRPRPSLGGLSVPSLVSLGQRPGPHVVAPDLAAEEDQAETARLRARLEEEVQRSRQFAEQAYRAEATANPSSPQAATAWGPPSDEQAAARRSDRGRRSICWRPVGPSVVWRCACLEGREPCEYCQATDAFAQAARGVSERLRSGCRRIS